MNFHNYLIIPYLLIIILSISSVSAEPYLAVRNGQACSACHVNPSGGGKRSDAGSLYGQKILAANPAEDVWNGRINPYLAIGADYRASFRFQDRKTATNEATFATDRASLYLEITPLNEYLTLYIDESLSPSASNRETYALLWNEDKTFYLKAGRFFLPYGLRLEDDTAFIRRVSGINFNNSDNGLEGGYESANWSVQAALSNGTSGGSETNTDKQLSLRVEHIQSSWRVGSSVNFNQTDVASERRMWNIFTAARWLGFEWLAEVDHITDISSTAEIDQMMALLESNFLWSKGHNVKLTLEFYDADRDVRENQLNRYSFVWEYSPISLIQLRAGIRLSEGIPQALDDQNDDLVFVQLHSWF